MSAGWVFDARCVFWGWSFAWWNIWHTRKKEDDCQTAEEMVPAVATEELDPLPEGIFTDSVNVAKGICLLPNKGWKYCVGDIYASKVFSWELYYWKLFPSVHHHPAANAARLSTSCHIGAFSKAQAAVNQAFPAVSGACGLPTASVLVVLKLWYCLFFKLRHCSNTFVLALQSLYIRFTA